VPKRKPVNTGVPPKLPTIGEFFEEMADKQGEEIRRLKQQHLGDVAAPNQRGSVKRKKTAKTKTAGDVTPYPWLLHPSRKRPSRKKSR
jgi:hypothetical protein